MLPNLRKNKLIQLFTLISHSILYSTAFQLFFRQVMGSVKEELLKEGRDSSVGQLTSAISHRVWVTIRFI